MEQIGTNITSLLSVNYLVPKFGTNWNRWKQPFLLVAKNFCLFQTLEQVNVLFIRQLARCSIVPRIVYPLIKK